MHATSQPPSAPKPLPATPLCLLWNPAPRSIQELLASPEYQALVAAGYRDGRIWVPFSLQSRFFDHRTGNRIVFSPHLERPESWQALPAGAWLLYLPRGMKTTPELLAALAAASPAQAPEGLCLPVLLRGPRGEHPLQDRPTPWNLVLPGRRFLAYRDEYLAFFLEQRPLPKSPGTLPLLDLPPLVMEDEISGLEYRLWAGLPPAPGELRPFLEESPALLAGYARLAGARELEELPLTLLRRLAAVRAAPSLPAGLQRLAELLNEARWQEATEAASGLLAETHAPALRARLLTLRGVALGALAQPQQALADLQHALEADAQDLTLRYLAAKLLRLWRQPRRSLELLEPFRQRHSHDAPPLRLMLLLCLEEGDGKAGQSVLEYLLGAFDHDEYLLELMLACAWRNGDLAALERYAGYLEALPPVPPHWPEQEWLLVRHLLRREVSPAAVLLAGRRQEEVADLLRAWGFSCRLLGDPQPAELSAALAQGPLSLLHLSAPGREAELLEAIPAAGLRNVGRMLLRFDLRHGRSLQRAVELLAAAGLKEGLVFQHPDRRPGLATWHRLTRGEPLSLDGELGLRGSLLLARGELFPLDLAPLRREAELDPGEMAERLWS